jgi:signal transduction histidine kinase
MTFALMLAVCMAAIACAIWFTATALRDNGLAVRQRLNDAYQAQLSSARKQLVAFWEEKEAALRAASVDASPSSAFATLVRDGTCDSALVLSDTGNLLYPLLPALEGKPEEETESGAHENAMLFALETMKKEGPEFDEAADRLATTLNDYREVSIPSARRIFLMSRLQQLKPDLQFPTLKAERLALQHAPLLLRDSATPGLSAPGPDMAAFSVKGQPVIALFQRAPLMARLQEIVTAGQGSGIEVRLLSGAAMEAEPFLTMPVGPAMPGWWLDLHLAGPDPFALEAARRQQAYLIAGGALVICVICLFGIATGYVARQVRLARLKNDLIATVSHELRTPISSIRVLVETLQQGGVTGERESREYLEMISKEIARLSRLIDNFLTFSRMERNKRKLDFAEVAMEELLRNAVDSAQDRFDRPECELRLECPERLPTVLGNRDSLMTVFLNLLDNAYKYTGESKKVAVRARSDGNDLVVEVEDNGIGISASEAKKVFDRFHQVDQGLARSVGGCGLGLAIVKHLVEAHGGAVSVRSEPGRGSTFTVRLPSTDPVERL